MKANFVWTGAVLACVAMMHCASQAAQQATNIEFIASGLEQHVGLLNDRVELKIYSADGSTALHKLELTLQRPLRQLSLPQGGTYRLSFASHEPDEEGATRCSATGELQVAANQNYRVSFTVLKRFCLLNTGRVAADGAYEELARVDGRVARLPLPKVKDK